jgi:hypothetical protein
VRYTAPTMSIKRSKQRSFSSRDRDDAAPGLGDKKIEPEKVWADEVAPKDDGAFVAYSPASRFTKGALLTHAKFGKGLVTFVEGARIEVLFEDGVKKLGHAG